MAAPGSVRQSTTPPCVKAPAQSSDRTSAARRRRAGRLFVDCRGGAAAGASGCAGASPAAQAASNSAAISALMLFPACISFQRCVGFLRAAIGFLQIDVPIAQFVERDALAGDGAADIEALPQDGDLVVAVVDLGFRPARIVLVHGDQSSAAAPSAQASRAAPSSSDPAIFSRFSTAVAWPARASCRCWTSLRRFRRASARLQGPGRRRSMKRLLNSVVGVCFLAATWRRWRRAPLWLSPTGRSGATTASGTGCLVRDANGAYHFDPELPAGTRWRGATEMETWCSTATRTTATLPPGAPRPSSAMQNQGPWPGCLDGIREVTSPSGQYRSDCRFHN